MVKFNLPVLMEQPLSSLVQCHILQTVSLCPLAYLFDPLPKICFVKEKMCDS